MSFELLIWLAVIIVSLVAPLLKERKRPGPEGRQGRPPGPRPGTAAPAETRHAELQDPEDDLLRRIEEARRRILEATGQQPEQRQPAAPPAARRPEPPLASTKSTQAAAERTRRLREGSSAGLQVTKLAKRETYTDARGRLSGSALLSRKGVLNGLVWHQILSEPPYRRAGRRPQSRLRSR